MAGRGSPNSRHTLSLTTLAPCMHAAGARVALPYDDEFVRSEMQEALHRDHTDVTNQNAVEHGLVLQVCDVSTGVNALHAARWELIMPSCAQYTSRHCIPPPQTREHGDHAPRTSDGGTGLATGSVDKDGEGELEAGEIVVLCGLDAVRA